MLNILIIDDSVILVQVLQNFFEAEGYNIIASANDGNQGVDLFKKHKPDLVTLDLTMPNKDGIDCLKEIMDADPSAKVLIVSAIKNFDIAEQCLKIGAKGFIEKPLRFQDEKYRRVFREAVRQATVPESERVS